MGGSVLTADFEDRPAGTSSSASSVLVVWQGCIRRMAALPVWNQIIAGRQIRGEAVMVARETATLEKQSEAMVGP